MRRLPPRASTRLAIRRAQSRCNSRTPTGSQLTFGPNAPAGKEKNWLRTVPVKGYFVIFRRYSPEKAIHALRKPVIVRNLAIPMTSRRESINLK
ncbi:DUF1214 domain-containing protein [Paraburkholderia oxyphila]|uniref:DUF1214 domain-containing protein n=1 Tax=Paraburkholderia oxyphila TaxID=614212 RepID=UPI001428BF8D|nr:DUF1214 domain-containing protein [Paraburkholderia oxyphila]